MTNFLDMLTVLGNVLPSFYPLYFLLRLVSGCPIVNGKVLPFDTEEKTEAKHPMMQITRIL